mmetsp:Transcript_36533/g.86770  ORF Transcript_36533/g.86770 Transcript_36533/m.86770 type:complete len:83 (+) Transcript_36533:2682-2930(+)
MSKFFNVRTHTYGNDLPLAIAYVPPTQRGDPLHKLYAARDPNPILTDHIGHALVDKLSHKVEMEIRSSEEDTTGTSLLLFTD